MATIVPLPARWWPARIVISLALLGAVVYGMVAGPGLGLRGRGLAALICTVLAALAWLVRTATFATDRARQPCLALAAVGLVLAGCLLMALHPAGPAIAFAGAGVFTAALDLAPATAVAVTAGGIGTLAAGTAAVGGGWLSFAGYAAGLAGISLGGFNRRQRRDRIEQAELLLAQTQRAQEERARAAALDERSRIAREIHDVLAHSLGALSVQLEAADALLAETRDPIRAQQHVARARELATGGLAETRRAIGALRGDTPPLAEQLRTLAADYRRDTGAAARVDIRERASDPAPDAALAVYRAAQEALTNIRKHSPGADVTLRLAAEDAGSVLTVTDVCADGAAPGALAGTGGGYGLTGLAERAESLGGHLTAGPDGAGWTLRLWLPT